MKKISLFGFNFNKKLYSIGLDSAIIQGELFFGKTKIALAHNDGNGGSTMLIPTVPRMELEQLTKDVSKAYAKLGVNIGGYELRGNEAMDMLVEDLIQLEMARKHCMKAAKQNGWKNPTITVYTNHQSQGIFLEATISDTPIDEMTLKKFLGNNVRKLVGSYNIDSIHVGDA